MSTPIKPVRPSTILPHRSGVAGFSKARKIWRNYSNHQPIENCLLQLRVCSIGRNTDVVDPLHQPVTLSYVILLFVTAILVIDIAVVAIADHERLQVARQTSAK